MWELQNKIRNWSQNSTGSKYLESITVIGFGGYVILPREGWLTVQGPKSADKDLVQRVYELLVDKNSKIVAKEKVSREEFDSLYRTWISGSCPSLGTEFDQISRLYIRHYLDKRTCGICDDYSKRWTMNVHVCNVILEHDEEVADKVYKLVLKQSENRRRYLYENVADVFEGRSKL